MPPANPSGVRARRRATLRRGAAAALATAAAAVGLTGGPGAASTVPSVRLVSPYVVYVGHGVALVAGETPTGCDRIFFSEDLTTWRDLSTTLPARYRCYFWGSASFVTRTDGWLLGRDAGSIETVLVHTADGGRTWRTQPGSTAGSNGGFEQIGFLNANDGWRQQVAIGTDGPYLLEHTATGGWGWQAVRTRATSGCEYLPDVFATPRLGDAAGGFGAPPNETGGFYFPYLWRTRDGGATWTAQRLGLPRGAPRSARVLVGEPTFLGRHGTVPVVYLTGHRQVVALYGTVDAGATWRYETQVDTAGRVVANAGGLCAHSSSVSSGHLVAVEGASFLDWWVLRPPSSASGRTDVYRIVHEHGAWHGFGTVARRLPVYRDGRDGIALWALDARRAVVVLQGDGYTQLYRTTDGGRDWTALPLSG